MGKDETLHSLGAFLWWWGVSSRAEGNGRSPREAQDHLQSWWHGRKNNHQLSKCQEML